MKFGRVNAIFIPSLLPDYFLGLPGFYLTTRDGMKSSENGFKVDLYGPSGFSDKLKDIAYIIGTLKGKWSMVELYRLWRSVWLFRRV